MQVDNIERHGASADVVERAMNQYQRVVFRNSYLNYEPEDCLRAYHWLCRYQPRYGNTVAQTVRAQSVRNRVLRHVVRAIDRLATLGESRHRQVT